MAGQRAFWVIVTGSEASAFRSRERDDLLPALKQLQRTQPDAVLKWFERGQLWESRLQAAEALERRRKSPSGRGRDWRPGGNHVDPRAKYQRTRDEKRARFKQRLRRDGPQSSSGNSVGRPKTDRKKER